MLGLQLILHLLAMAQVSIEETMALATWILHNVLCNLELRITALNLATKVCSAEYLLLFIFY